jgi:hypothetical protein
VEKISQILGPQDKKLIVSFAGGKFIFENGEKFSFISHFASRLIVESEFLISCRMIPALSSSERQLEQLIAAPLERARGSCRLSPFLPFSRFLSYMRKNSHNPLNICLILCKVLISLFVKHIIRLCLAFNLSRLLISLKR